MGLSSVSWSVVIIVSFPTPTLCEGIIGRSPVLIIGFSQPPPRLQPDVPWAFHKFSNLSTSFLNLLHIFLTSSDTIQTLPDTLRHHPDTPQKPPFLTCMRPLGERVISEYHNIYSTVFNFSDNCLTQTSARHAQILSRNCQTPSDTIQTPFKRPYFTVIWSYVISILLGPLVH